MSDLYNRIDALCKERGTNITALCRDAKVARASLSELKAGRTKTLTLETGAKLASVLKISVDELMGTETKKAPTLTKKDERDIASKLNEIMNDLENSGTLMFDGDPMSDEARESMRAAIKLGLEAAKLKNKERFTPKKYRKD